LHPRTPFLIAVFPSGLEPEKIWLCLMGYDKRITREGSLPGREDPLKAVLAMARNRPGLTPMSGQVWALKNRKQGWQICLKIIAVLH